ncbi:MAG: DUF554 domain-containing protein [Negativicutes bacterium]|nr:DUF554 domain-containing protein [Negativicutes bacterium]
MTGMGTIVNAAAILAGAGAGLILRQGLPDKWQETIMHAIGLSVTVIGIQMALKTNNIIIVIISLVAGSIIGELLDIDKALNCFGTWVGGKLSNDKEKGSAAAIIGQGFVATSLIYCVGAMAIVGSIQEGLTGDASTLFAKSILDGITAIIFAANMGVGVALSAVSVALYQGSLTFLAGSMEAIMTPLLLAELTATGGILIIAIGLNMLKLVKIRIANMLPAIIAAGIVTELFAFFN